MKLKIKDEGKPSVVLDKKKGLDVRVLVIAGNMIDFQSLCLEVGGVMGACRVGL